MNLPLSQAAPSGELLSASSIAPALDRASLTTAMVGLGRASQSLLFIDGGVQDYSQLVAGVAAGTEVHVLDPVQDAVAQITQVLLGRQGISSLHIVSHGESGRLDFGSSRLNLTDFPGYAAQLQSWGQALTDDADILLYGCDVAAGELGQAFVQILSQVTGADVAASDDLTGNSALGGDWTLEYQTGDIEAFQPFDSGTQAAYRHTLATFTVLNTDDSGANSLRQAILDANATPGDDTITFTGSVFVDATPDIITLTSGELGISSNISLVGTGANLLTISGGNTSRVFNISSGVVGIDKVTIANGNAGAGIGGGLLNSGTLTLTNSIIQNNITANALNGHNCGGLYNGGTVTISDSTLRNNTGFFGGALVNAAGSTASLTNTTVANNTAGGQGGAIQNEGSMTITSSTISGNTAPANGGGIMNITATASMSITNSTISGNTGAAGGGIRNTFNATLTLANVTVANNTATAGGGGVSVGSGTVNIKNTLIANNSHATTPDVGGTFVDQGNNLIGKGNGSTGLTNGTNGNIVGTIAAPIDPLLGALDNNGGPTQTHALLAGSRAVNAGSNTGVTANDQRGSTRIVNGLVDIGALESNLDIISLTAPDSSATEAGDTATYRISRSGTTGALVVNLTLSGTASASDYSVSGGSITVSGTTAKVTIPDGLSFVDVTLTAVDDIQAEASETIVLTLAAGTYTIAAANTGTATIAQNDFVVINTNDSGEGSLRQAVLNANAIAGTQDITFSLAAGAQTITIDPLPDLTDSVNILNTTGAANLTIRGAATTYPLFQVRNSATVSFEQFTLANALYGIANQNGTISAIRNLIITGATGSGILNAAPSTIVLIDGLQLIDNSSNALVNNGTITTLTNTTIQNTISAIAGLSNFSTGTINRISNTTISGNATLGLRNFGQLNLLENTTISGNGTGLQNSATGTLTTLRNVTIAGSTSISLENAGTITNAFNNLLVGNGSVSFGSVTNLSNNLVGTFAALGVDSTLRNNGGTTQTHALLPGSGAIDTGTSTSAPTTDQRGITRGTAVDIGAFESRGFTITASAGSDQSTPRNTLFDGFLLATVSSAFGEPVNGGTITFTAPSTGASTTTPTQTATIAAGQAIVGETANDTAGTYTVSASANGIATPASFSLTNTNTRPALTNISKGGIEDTPVSFTSADFTAQFTDDDSDSLTKIQITALPTKGILKLGSKDVTLNQEITLAELAILTYVPNPDSTGSDSFGWNGFDGLDYATTGASVNLTIAAINDAPILTLPASLSVNEDAGAQALANFATLRAGPATATDEVSQTLTVTTTVTGTTGNLAFTTAPSIDSNGTLRFQTAANTFGTATLSVVVTDSGSSEAPNANTSRTQTFTLTVNSVNDQPTLTATNPPTVNEDAGAQTLTNWASFTPGPADEAAQTATYTVSNLSNPSLFTVAPTIAANGTLTYTAAPDAFGTVTFDVTVRDNGGTANGGVDTSTTRTFTLTVNSVNDAPSVTPNANPVVTAGAGTQTIANFASFNPGVPNEAGQTATYTIVSNSNPSLFSGQPTIAPDGTLVFTPVASLDSPQTATLTVQVQDSGGTANGGLDTSTIQSFTLTVNPAPLPTPPATGAAPIFTIFQLKQTFTLNRANQKLLAGQPSPVLQQLFDEEYYLRQNPDVATACDRGVFQSGFQHFLQYGQFEGRNPSALFNESYYLSQNADVAAAVARGNFRSGFQHFLQYGQFEGRSFSTLYNERSYLAQNADVVAAIARGGFRTGFQHFLQFGFAEGRLPSLTLFNEAYYLSQNPDVAAAVARGVFKNGLHHFEQYGQFEGRQPSTLFNERYYLSQNPDVAAAVAQGRFKSGFDHYLDFGRFEGRAGVG